MATVMETEAPQRVRRPRPKLFLMLAPDRADSAALRHLAAAAVFLLVASLLALITIFEVATSGGTGILTYGRMYPIYTSTALFGWLFLAGTGAAYYLAPRLTGVRLWREDLANANLWLIVLVDIAGALTLTVGLNEGRVMLEFPIWLDPLVLLMLAVPAVVVSRTIAGRRERNLYVSSWYLLAAPYWGLLLFAIASLPGLSGVSSAIQARFFSESALTLWIAGLATAAIYYVVPKVTGNALYSRPLALIGFWSLAFTEPWTGATRLVYGPVPEWLGTVAAVFSVGALLPILAVVANLVGTMRGTFDMLSRSWALRFTLLGAAAYVVVGIMNALGATRSASAVIGFTSWHEATVALTIFGVLTSWLAAFVYYGWPRLIGRDWFSSTYGEWHFRFTAGGLVVMAMSLWAAGLLSGYTWAAGASTGAFANVGEGFAQTVSGVAALHFLATLAMLAIGVGQAIFVLNLYRTYTSGRVIAQEMLVPIRVEEPVSG